MIKNYYTKLLCALLLPFTSLAFGNDFAPDITKHANTVVKKWLSEPVIINAINAQNEAHNSITQAEIDKLDKTWRAEVSAASQPLINKILKNELSAYLKGIKDESDELYTEIFVMDNKGLNVGQSDVTSDYWQGDEAKWKKTYMVGNNSMHISEVEEDESTQTFQSQLSLPIVDPKTEKVIGAITIGINLENL